MVTLVRLGMGAAQASRLVYGHQAAVATAAGDRCVLGRRRWLRGQPLRLGPFTVDSSTAISAAIFISLGAVFLANRRTGGLAAFFAPARLQAWGQRAQDWASTAQAQIPNVVLLVVVAATIIVVTVWRLRCRRAGVHDPGGAGACVRQGGGR